MAVAAPSELLSWLGEYQFLRREQLESLGAELGRYADTHALVKELIRRDWLTPFQANQILQGKGEQLVLESYRLRERIGEGAMGQVFKAWQPTLDRVVAIKMIRADAVTSPKTMERFRREVEAAGQLDHPNIAKVYDARDVDGRPYFVMEFIDGFNLSTRVKQHGPLPIEDAVEYVRQTALGLQHAYEKGIVHRDIKPGNILVTSAKAHGEHKSLVKILDFGLARFASEGAERERLTEVGKLLGTIDYMAPEQAHAARDADIRADIYSLGCTLYYLLTGRPPFGGETVLEKLTPRMTGEAPWIRAVRPEIAPALEDVIRTMMARRPEDRPLTPLDAANALAPFAQSEPRAPGTAAAPLFGSPLGVAMALPVAPDAVRGEVMMAQPIMASASPEDPSFLGMTATGRDMSDASAAATPRAPTTKRPLPAKLLLLLGGGAALVSLVSCACILGMLYFRDATPRKSGTVRITQVKWSTEDQKLIPGRHHHALVWIERVDFQGPVKIWFKELPPGVVSDELTLAPQIDRGQVKVTVSFGTEPVKKTVKIVAECEEAGARVEMPIALEVKADPAGLKKQAK